MNSEKGLNHMVSKLWANLMSDGAGLFCAVLDHLLGSHDERPKVLIVWGNFYFLTQGNSLSWYAVLYSLPIEEILQGGFIRETSHLKYNHMEVYLQDEGKGTSNEVVFLYK